MYKRIDVKADCKCNKCGDIFQVNSEGLTSCREGCCSVRVSEYTSSYSTYDGKSNCYKIIEESEEITYDENYYIKPTKEILDIVDKLKSKGYPVHLYKSVDRNTNGIEYLKYVDIEFDTESNEYYERNTFEATISLTKYNDDNSEGKILEKFNQVLDVYNRYESGELDLSPKNRKNLKDEFYWERRQAERYDYTFTIVDED